MKIKKARSGKAVKAAARTARAATKRKAKTSRANASLAKTKRAKTKKTKKPVRAAGVKPRSTAKKKRVTKRVIRRRVTKPPSIPLENEQPALPIATSPEELFATAFPGQIAAPSKFGAEEIGEQPLKAESGLKAPAILLEGDEPPSIPMGGPGQKYALGPAAAGAQAAEAEVALPDAYGTGKLLLAARDPHWLYAHWDLTSTQQRHYNALSVEHHLVVRVYPRALTERPIREVHVHPESRHWFIHVDQAETPYLAEIGYYRAEQDWVRVATSSPTATPTETVSTDQTVRFATIPTHVRLSELAALAKPTAAAHLPPMEAARERALAELVGMQHLRQDWVSSMEVQQAVRGGGEQDVDVAQMSQPGPPGGESESITSPSGAQQVRPQGFWFGLNADLVLHGGTEPDATVTIGGRPIQLRPDGTFSCRISLPNGDHVITVSAQSAQGETRRANLQVTRQTEYQGEGPANVGRFRGRT